MRYCFLSDDDGHWYLVPAEQADRFEDWMEWWANGDGDSPYDGPDFSDFRIGGGPEGYTFTDPAQDN